MKPHIQTAAKIIPDHATGSECPACGAMEAGVSAVVYDHEYALDDLARYCECPACGTLFQTPMPSLKQLAAFYPPDYHSMTHAGLLNRVRNGMRIRRLAKLCRRDGPILDYGCGDGAFLLQAAHTLPEREFWGFEISDHAETSILAGGRVTIVRGSPDDLFGLLPCCALITLNHVIEHLPDPLAVVSALTERLLPDGIFEGQTPASDSLERSVFRVKWSGYHAPRHTVIFSRAGLCRMLERAGLSAAKVQGAFNPAGIAVSLGSVRHARAGRIPRSGARWTALIALAAALAPLDLYSGRPGIIDFVAHKPPSHP
jgi:SAM-dependent methyltransferase